MSKADLDTLFELIIGSSTDLERSQVAEDFARDHGHDETADILRLMRLDPLVEPFELVFGRKCNS